MSLQGIPGGGGFKPKLAEETPASPPPGGENVGGAKQKTHMDKINESHKALHKSRSEQRDQMVKFMVTKAANAAHTMKNAMLKPVKPERVAEHNFHKIAAHAIKHVTKKIAVRNAKRANMEGNSSAEDMKLKNASMQAAMSVRSKQLETDDDVDTDTDSSGGGELSGGSKDQVDIIMMLKSMYGEENHPDLEKMADEVKDTAISNEQKIKVVSGMINSGIKPGNEESNKLINLVNSDDFNKLSDKTKDTLFDLIEGKNPQKTDYQSFNRSEIDGVNKQMTGPLAGLTLNNKADLQLNSLTSVNQLSAKTDDLETKVTIVQNGKVNQPKKIVNDKLFGSSIEFKVNPKISAETFKNQADDSLSKLFLAANNEAIGINPADMKKVVQTGIDKVFENLNKISDKNNVSVNFRIPLGINNSEQVETSGIMIKLNKTRLSVD